MSVPWRAAILAAGMASCLLAMSPPWPAAAASSSTTLRLGLHAAQAVDATNGTLTLALRPGPHPPCLGDIGRVPPDITPQPITTTVPLYAGAIASTDPSADAPLGVPAVPYLKTACAEYVIPTDPATADAWYRTAFVQRGYTVGASATGSDPSGFTTATSFTPQVATRPTVELGYKAISNGRTLLLYFAYVIAVPPRPAGSYLPPDIARVRVSYHRTVAGSAGPNGPGGHDLYITRTIANRAAIAKLVTTINSLHRSDEGVVNCPNERYTEQATMIFDTRSGKHVPVSVSGFCVYTVVVAHYPPLEAGNILALLRSLLHAPPPAQ